MSRRSGRTRRSGGKSALRRRPRRGYRIRFRWILSDGRRIDTLGRALHRSPDQRSVCPSARSSFVTQASSGPWSPQPSANRARMADRAAPILFRRSRMHLSGFRTAFKRVSLLLDALFWAAARSTLHHDRRVTSICFSIDATEKQVRACGKASPVREDRGNIDELQALLTTIRLYLADSRPLPV